MSGDPAARIVKYPTDAEVRAAFEAYVTGVGKVAHAWNYLHERLGALFAAVLNTPDRNVAAAVWYSPYVDRVQREMLRAAIEAMAEYRWQSLPNDARDDLKFVLKEIDAVGYKRDDAIHAPASLYTDYTGSEMAASFLSGHRRAKNLAGKQLLIEFDWCERYSEELSRFVAKATEALLFGGVQWPSRPRKPDRKPKRSLQGPERAPASLPRLQRRQIND
jgi:hypothetical protein